jgi:iron(III) transport system permease protein
LLDIAIYLFVNAMTPVSATVLLYGLRTELTSVSVLNMDGTAEVAAAAMAKMIFYTNVAARMAHAGLARGAWSDGRRAGSGEGRGGRVGPGLAPWAPS